MRSRATTAGACCSTSRATAAFNEGARDAFLHVIELAALDANDVAELLATQSTSTEQELS
jgi:hypothetical protein